MKATPGLLTPSQMVILDQLQTDGAHLSDVARRYAEARVSGRYTQHAFVAGVAGSLHLDFAPDSQCEHILEPALMRALGVFAAVIPSQVVMTSRGGSHVLLTCGPLDGAYEYTTRGIVNRPKLALTLQPDVSVIRLTVEHVPLLVTVHYSIKHISGHFPRRAS